MDLLKILVTTAFLSRQFEVSSGHFLNIIFMHCQHPTSCPFFNENCCFFRRFIIVILFLLIVTLAIVSCHAIPNQHLLHFGSLSFHCCFGVPCLWPLRAFYSNFGYSETNRSESTKHACIKCSNRNIALKYQCSCMVSLMFISKFTGLLLTDYNGCV